MTTKNKTSRRKAKPASGIKAFVLDTNVLIHDPECIFQFQENLVFLPVEVLEELDNFKSEQTERGASARRVNRTLDSLFAQDPNKMKDGVELPNGGRLFVIINPHSGSVGQLLVKSQFPNDTKQDNRILASAMYVSESQPPPVILITKDVNMRLKALSLGMRADDYLTDKKNLVVENKHSELLVSPNMLERFHNEGRVTMEHIENIGINEYLLLVDDTNPNHRVPCRHYGSGEFRKLITPNYLQIPKGITLKPRSFEQAFLMDAILDPNIPLVTVQGKAGTGKTIVSIGAALALLGRDDSPYDGITISRPVVAMGKDLGALPGGLDEKLRPWLQPYYDALGVLMPTRSNREQAPIQHMQERQEHRGQQNQGAGDFTRKDRKHFRKDKQRQPYPNAGGGNQGGPSMAKKPWELLQAAGVLEIEALQYIRGRSIPRRIFILDEAQQLTPHEAKTVITRMSEGSKVIIMGDPAQIDNPYVDSRSNGLVVTQNKLRNQKLAAHVKLLKGERSALAELGATML